MSAAPRNLSPLPDVERMVSAYLRGRPEVAALVEDRVYTVIPQGARFPLIRLWRFGGIPALASPLVLDTANLQVDAYGGPKSLAWQVLSTARAVLSDGLVGDYGEGVIYGADFGTARYLPDDSFDPPKPRYLAEVTVYARAPYTDAPAPARAGP